MVKRDWSKHGVHVINWVVGRSNLFARYTWVIAHQHLCLRDFVHNVIAGEEFQRTSGVRKVHTCSTEKWTREPVKECTCSNVSMHMLKCTRAHAQLEASHAQLEA